MAARRTTGLLLAMLGLVLIPPGFAQKPQDEQQKGKSEPAKRENFRSDTQAKSSGGTILRIEVTAGEKDKPVESASVYVKVPQERLLGRERMIEMNVKTNPQGTVRVPNVPRGKVLIQVIAPGWKTYGRWYDLDQAEQTIKIKLEKPTRWY